VNGVRQPLDVTLGRALVGGSMLVFAATGLGYLMMPGAMLSIVGIESTATAEFLIRTEGVALLAAAGFLTAALDARPARQAVVLACLAGYYVLSSIVDLMAYRDGIVGSLAVPSIAVRFVVGAACAWAAVSLRSGSRA
jgi:hypothetical protein